MAWMNSLYYVWTRTITEIKIIQLDTELNYNKNILESTQTLKVSWSTAFILELMGKSTVYISKQIIDLFQPVTEILDSTELEN